MDKFIKLSKIVIYIFGYFLAIYIFGYFLNFKNDLKLHKKMIIS